jgi:hypothetical protein
MMSGKLKRNEKCVASVLAMSTSDVTVLWHVDPLLGNDREISSYTIAAVR